MNTALVAKSMNLPLLVDSLDSYIQTVNRLPTLSAEEEQDLARRLQQRNELEAARQLIMAHLRFVVHIARGYSGYGLALADLVQEGNVGLMKAVKRFDPDHGVRLVSFAVHWIKAEIHEYVIRNWRMVKIATTKAQRKLFFNLRKAKKRLGWFSQEEVENVATNLNVTTKDVLEMESRLNGQDQSFDLSGDDDDESNFAPVQYLEDKTADVAIQFETENAQLSMKNKLYSALSTLDARSQDIVSSRWLSEPKATLHDLATRYSISAERIRQLEANAIKKLQSNMDFA